MAQVKHLAIVSSIFKLSWVVFKKNVLEFVSMLACSDMLCLRCYFTILLSLLFIVWFNGFSPFAISNQDFRPLAESKPRTQDLLFVASEQVLIFLEWQWRNHSFVNFLSSNWCFRSQTWLRLRTGSFVWNDKSHCLVHNPSHLTYLLSVSFAWLQGSLDILGW